ncbi:Protein scd2/ral3 [Mycena sanguinolenta]|uniref:Protein scd2/ral3 n=1 Tax=Mycena sanguinolenta TaxID=230812 RepID=A0A8H7D188_9AGAR|nr:Protein scd2/ral3 [Mycena sanguinolenta]
MATRRAAFVPRFRLLFPSPAVSKPPSAILPPQKVIRALSEYRPQAPQQLPFKKGDFFYVLRDVDSNGTWYEAHNPVTGARGLVPKDRFEEFNKSAAPLRSLGSPDLQPVSPQQQFQSLSPMSSPKAPTKTQVFYAIVLHDFAAERADELEAKRGDAITVVAQSNREWFVAKPIGRLGRPGLIPVSFVEIHDPSTGRPIPDVNALMDRGDLPKVEDWKRAMFNYKQNSIALGVIDSPNPRESVTNSPYAPQHSPAAHQEPAINVQGPSPHEQAYSNNVSNPPPPETPDALPEGILLSANVVSFHYEMEEYWFRVDAIFQPYASPGEPLPPAKSLILFRVYNDFYDFQLVASPPHPRLLPYMPGPADNVDDALTATRRSELDEYVVSLCELSAGARYVLEHLVVREFLALKPGDVENIIPPRVQDIEALFSQGQSDPYGDDANGVQDSFGQLRVDDEGGSDYEDEGPLTADGIHMAKSRTDGHREIPITFAYKRTPKIISERAPTHRSHGRDHPPPSRWNDNGSNPPPTSSPSSASASLHSNSRSRSGSVANINSPSISAANPQTAFVKIKIFDRIADDLIAIRVHPRVTHMELMDKVQSRLGGEVARLKYRDSMSNQFVGMDSDQQLRAWIEGTDKHVLYAD